MKKFLSVMAAACCAMALNATIYTCLNENNGAYDLDLKNFVLISEGVAMPVGNVTVTGVEGVDEHGFTKLNFNGTINITEGNDPQYDFWMGPMLGPVPTVATARFIDTAISGDLFIDLSSTMNQIISVSIFGVAPASEGLEGDVNKDSEVNIADVNRVVDIILSK